MSFGNVPRDLCLTSLATSRSIASKSANGYFSADIRTVGSLLQYQRSPGVWVTAESLTVPATQLGSLYTLPFDAFSASFSLNGSILAFGLSPLAYGDSIVSIFTNTDGFYTQTTIPLPPSAINLSFPFTIRTSVSLNDAGDVLALSIPVDDNDIGAVWLYVSIAGVWTLIGPKITGVGEIGPGLFGNVVSLSGAGNLLAVGCVQDNGSFGAVYIFNLNNLLAPVFVQKLIGTVAGALFGAGLDLSADGSTLAVSSGTFGQPILVYTNVTGTWTQQASLNFPLDFIGVGSDSLSADGNTICTGSFSNAVIFYRTPGPSWSTGALLPLPYDLLGIPFGYFPSISHDGNTIFTSSQFNNNSVGASWIFTQGPLGTWIQNGPGLIGTGGTLNVFQGLVGTLSGDGKVVALGNSVKEVWVFV